MIIKRKEVPPLNTIKRISEILLEESIITFESGYLNFSGFHSCRTIIGNMPIVKYDFGTNGKGINPEFALASSHAELMERLQNGCLFNNYELFGTKHIATICKDRYLDRFFEENNIAFHFAYSPEEYLMSLDEYIDKYKVQLERLIYPLEVCDIQDVFSNNLKSNKLICADFTNLINNEVVPLPLELLYNIAFTNGLCAGNTKEEAVVQGICEIFERFVIKEIFEKECVLPSISREVIEDEELLKSIEVVENDNNYKISVKDCSLGRGLPVIGVLIYDMVNDLYAFHLGSSPSLSIAIERCITEVFQTLKPERFNKRNALFEGISDNIDYSLFKHSNFMRKIKDGTGAWPDSVYQDKTPVMSVLNHFSNYDNAQRQYQQTLVLLKDLNYDVYVRNSNYLGFPAFQVYIPGMSELNTNYPKEILRIHWSFYLKNNGVRIINNLYEASSEEIEIIVDFFELFDKRFDEFALLHLGSDLEMNKASLMMMLNYRLNRFDKCLYHVEELLSAALKENDSSTVEYLMCIKSFFTKKLENLDDLVIQEYLLLSFGHELVDEIMVNFKSSEELCKRHRFPRCFDCDKCELKSNCDFKSFMRFISKLKSGKVLVDSTSVLL